MSGQSIYQRLGHDRYVALRDHIGAPLPACVRDAKPAPARAR